MKKMEEIVKMYLSDSETWLLSRSATLNHSKRRSKTPSTWWHGEKMKGSHHELHTSCQHCVSSLWLSIGCVTTPHWPSLHPSLESIKEPSAESWKGQQSHCQNELMYSFGHNSGFMRAICVIDGTEIKISCPSHHLIQMKTYTGLCFSSLGQIDADDVVHICSTLAIWRIKKKPFAALASVGNRDGESLRFKFLKCIHN